MKDNHFKQIRCLLAVILSITMLSACSVPQTAPPPQSDSQYEQYKADDLSAQKKFDELTQTFFKEQITKSGLDLHYTLADPSTRGIAKAPQIFGDFSVDSMKKDFDDIKKLMKELNTIPIQQLTVQQKLSYKILYTYLETELSAEGMELYAQPLTSIIGIQTQLPILLAEYPFYTRQDVDNYLELISTIDTYYEQLLHYEKQKAEAGLFMSDIAADHVLESCEVYLIQPDHSFLAETFNTRIDELAGLSEEDRAAYKALNLTVLQKHFVPAYRALIDGITALMGTGKNELGLYYFPKGKEYFEYMVKSNVTASYDSIPKLKKAIKKQMDSDLNALGQIVKEYPKTPDLLDTYAFRYKEPEEILNSLKEQISIDFPALPPCTHTVKYVPTTLETSLSPAFYLVPPIDQYQDNIIYINGASRFEDEHLYTTLAHEGYPGHLYQNVYFYSKNTCDLRSILPFSSYSEGWSTYVEYYSYTMDNGLDPQLGKLLAHNTAVSLGLYALLDIYINYEGWDKDQVAEYLAQFYSIEGTDIVDSIFHSIVENPTNYMEYYVGFLEIMEMRNTAQKILKENFSLKDFHTFLLDIGPAQFSIIQPYFQLWLYKK